MADLSRQAMRLAQQLHAAVHRRDWTALHALDAEVSVLLRQVRPTPWPPQELAALTLLHEAHQQAREHCAQVAERMASQLTDMRSSKDGWIAYAKHSEWNDGSTPS